jgi:hypothetical protein
MHKNGLMGYAGELRVASELLLKGHEVFFGSGNSEIDIILGDGRKIQVKTSSNVKRNVRYNHTGYYFTFRHWTKKKAQSLENIDFVICWLLNTDVFYIVPVEKLKGVSSISINPRRNRRNGGKRSKVDWDGFKNKWDLLESRRR